MSPSIAVRTRWDDCDRYGHVNNAAYLALLREATERAFPAVDLGRPAEIVIDYRSPLPRGAVVDIGIEADAAPGGAFQASYSFVLEGRVASIARVRWRRSASTSVALPTLPREVESRPFSFSQTVRTYELGPDGEVRAAVVLQWLEQAVFRAAERVGWDAERMREANFVTLQIGHHLVLAAPARLAEELFISSRLVQMRRVSGMWHHEVRRSDGALIAADRSRGAFVDLAGRVRQAPEAMIAALLRGEPDARA